MSISSKPTTGAKSKRPKSVAHGADVDIKGGDNSQFPTVPATSSTIPI